MGLTVITDSWKNPKTCLPILAKYRNNIITFIHNNIKETININITLCLCCFGCVARATPTSTFKLQPQINFHSSIFPSHLQLLFTPPHSRLASFPSFFYLPFFFVLHILNPSTHILNFPFFLLNLLIESYLFPIWFKGEEKEIESWLILIPAYSCLIWSHFFLFIHNFLMPPFWIWGPFLDLFVMDLKKLEWFC